MTKTYELTSRPWWLSHAVATPRGVVVARADAVSTINRKPTADDIAAGIAHNQYDFGPECHGAFVGMMVDLTEQDLAEMGLTPGVLEWPRVIDGPRPKINRTDAPVSQAQEQRAIDLLMSEGHCDDPEPDDNTPWQKGDDYAE